ncbi:MAG: Ni/Fe-hydrogenase cytochrome b subunit [bacterium]
MERREFFRTCGAIGALAAAPGTTPAEAKEAAPPTDGFGVLCDLTLCVGCRKCEWACNQAQGLPARPMPEFETRSVYAEKRRPDASAFTVVNEFRPEGAANPTWVKVQCMHCLEPACASACIVSALERNERGPVTYDAGRCIGCRYCMVACPFQIPGYEYQSPLTPRVRKCSMCANRVLEDATAVPACVEICPPQCLTFGKRSQLLELASRKRETHAGRYVDHVYGEHEVGGTSWMYVAGVPFDQLGFPALSSVAPPRRTERLQHAVFKNFVPPLGLYGLLYGISWLFRRREEHGGAQAHAPSPSPAPVQGSFRTPAAMTLLGLAVVAFVFTVARFVLGLAGVTHLDDRYPWGIWIAIDVAGGVALAAGGFTTAALAHIFHREDFEPIARPALLSALLGYTFVVLGLAVDLGRPYRLWHPAMPWMWSGHSVLFEVGMCVMVYLTVLYLEFLPVVIERLRGRVRLPGPLRPFEKPVETVLTRADGVLRALMPFLLVAGVVLSCLHQSSLGALMLVVPSKMNALWYTPVLPLLFLLSAIMVGYPVVILESLLSARAFRRPPEIHLLERLARIVPVLVGVYFISKVADLTIRDQWGAVFRFDLASRVLLVEMLFGLLAPIVILASARRRRSPQALLAAALLVIGGVALNRIDVFLVAYAPPYAQKPYFPSVGEIGVTVGLFATLAVVYRWLVTRLPVLPAAGAGEAS